MIRKWLLEKDYVEAIIKLTDQGFIDTGITIYAWVLSKGAKRGTKREGWIQLINAENIYHPLKKGIGMKRKEMTEEDIDTIVKLYTEFNPKDNNENVKYVRKEELYYYEVLVQQPYQRNFVISEDRIANLYSESSFNKLYNEEDYLTLLDSPATDENLQKIKDYRDGKNLQEEIIKTLQSNLSDKVYRNLKEFEKRLKELFPVLKPTLIKAIANALSEKDKESDTYQDKRSPSGLLADNELNDIEYVPFLKEIKDYFNEEVKPFVPDSWYVFNPTKCGCEINFNKYFYVYTEPEKSENVLKKIKSLQETEENLLKELF